MNDSLLKDLVDAYLRQVFEAFRESHKQASQIRIPDPLERERSWRHRSYCQKNLCACKKFG
jgi:hypothetical protein